jgi:uncharacterized protein YggT (Ycf19 family)
MGLQLILHNILYVCTILIVVRVLASYFPQFREDGSGGSFARLLVSVTDPILAPFHAVSRPLASRTGIDLSALFALLAFQMLDSLILRI